MKSVYVLYGDISEWGHKIFGVFTTAGKMLDYATKLLNQEPESVLDAFNDEYGYTGLAFYYVGLIGAKSATKREISYDFDLKVATIKK